LMQTKAQTNVGKEKAKYTQSSEMCYCVN